MLYCGELITPKERNRRDSAMKSMVTYFFKLDDFIVDATIFGNTCRFVNHTCQNSNAMFRKVAYHIPGGDERHIVLRSTRPIKKNEEILANYDLDGPAFFGNKCLCKWH